jgi:acetoin utilization deacetylase AcuC-like enzyme
MGFCLFNNAAVAARFAQRAYGIQRVAILDWDVHHGNGTQDIFIDDPSILYCSTHGWPLWPGSGHWREMGGRSGEGSTLNVPLPAMTGDMGFHQTFTNVLVPAIKAFRPELLIISAGYDAHLQDPLGPLALSTAGYANLASIVYNLAADVCDGRLVGVLEGGYNLEALGRSVVTTLRTWLGVPHGALAHDSTHVPEPDITALLETLRHHHPLVETGNL